MTIRQKALLLIGSLLVFSLVLIFITSRTVLLEPFSTLELRGARNQLTLVFRVLDSRKEELADTAAAFGSWTKTYQFMLDGKPDFINDDLTPEELRSANIDYLLLVTTDGTIRASGTTKTVTPPVPGIASDIRERLLRIATVPGADGRQQAGFLRMGNRYFIVASHPIIPSGTTKVSRGTVVCAKELRPADLNRLAELAGQPFALLSLDSPELRPWVRERLKRMMPAGHLEFNVDDETLEGVGALKDLLSGDTIVVHLHGNRDFFRQSKSLVGFFIATTIMVGTILSLAMLAMLGRIVLNPLAQLNRQVAHIGGGEALVSVTPPGGKELDGLAHVINDTMQKLRDSEERYRLFVQNFPGIAFRSDFDFKPEFLHGAVEAITGYPVEEFLNSRIRWDAIVHHDDLPTLTKACSLLKKIPGHTADYEYRITRQDGSIRLLHSTWQGVCCDEAGHPKAIQQVIYDFTEQRLMEQQVRESEERYRTFIQNFTGIAFRVRFGAEVIFLHGAVEAITGYTPEEFSARAPSWRDIVFPGDVERFDQITAELSRAPGTIKELEYRIVRKDGDIRWIYELISASFDGRHPSLVAQGAAYDITDRKRTEEALVLARDEAERANRAKSEFLANMSHELRTPLTAVLGLSEMLQEQTRGELNAHQMKSIRTIEESGRHLMNLINDILDLARIEAGRMALVTEMVKVEALCRSCLQIVAGPAAAKRISLSLNLDRSPEEIETDPLRLTQILVNLLSNGVKFTPEGGAVGVRVTGFQEQRIIRFTVWDTGIGISRDDQHRLFSPFVQLDSSLSRQHQGSGLGLALVARLAEIQEGEVSVESEPGVGSRFSVTIPWHETPKPTGPYGLPPTDVPRTVGSAGTAGTGTPDRLPLVLLAEDNPATREMTSEYLQGKNYRVLEAINGTEVIELLVENKPDLILMDIQMPGLDGIETIRRIRALPPPKREIPIIAVTAFAMQGDRDRCLSAGANDYLSKPVRLNYLAEQVERLLTTSGPSSLALPALAESSGTSDRDMEQ